jgi:hypothetical protein
VLLYERKRQPADLTEGMLLVEMECLRLHTLGNAMTSAMPKALLESV